MSSVRVLSNALTQLPYEQNYAVHYSLVASWKFYVNNSFQPIF